MPYNWNGDYVPSKADKNTNVLGEKEIGGVGQLIYHPFRFKDYEFHNITNGYYVFPICSPEYEPVFPTDDSVSGKGLLVSLCNLAKQLDDFENNTSKDEQIITWCKENVHPYQIDSVYSELTDKHFDIKSHDSARVCNDASFTIDDFMEDLGKLYNAVLFYEALEGICVAEEEDAYNLYKEGKYFERYSFFEHYKLRHDIPDIDVSSANGDIIEEMKLYREYEQTHPAVSPDGEFAVEPYDSYDELRDKLIDLIPDFRIRLKVNPKTSRLEFSADVNSVFDIGWYTLARMLSEDPAPENKGTNEKRAEGIMICCKNCGSFFIRRNSRQEYCNRPDCQKARNAKNQRAFRRNRRIENAQEKKKETK